jgi:hypothetical protein
VIDGFRREITSPAERGANLAEAAQCLDLLMTAYLSHADGGRRRELRAELDAQPARAATP